MSAQPLIGAICLAQLDGHLATPEVLYVRFMDDWVVLTKNRRQLRGAVKVTNQTLSALKLEKHPDKTFIGRIEKGFDFLGYHFSPKGLRVAQSTLNNFVAKATRLYEQKPRSRELGMYVRRWLGWAGAALTEPMMWPGESSCPFYCGVDLNGLRPVEFSLETERAYPGRQ